MFIFTIIGIIVVVMLLFSFFNKNDRSKIIDKKDQDLVEAERREFAKSIIDVSSMDGLVRRSLPGSWSLLLHTTNPVNPPPSA